VGMPAHPPSRPSGSGGRPPTLPLPNMRATVAIESDLAAEERRKCCAITPTFSVDVINKR
jgi:hypothetical protein